MKVIIKRHIFITDHLLVQTAKAKAEARIECLRGGGGEEIHIYIYMLIFACYYVKNILSS